jgi:diguanylate cyclase (GGDEF)-like protein
LSPKPETKVSIDQEGVRWSSRTVAKIEVLLMILVLLSLGFAGVDHGERAAIVAGLCFYASFVLGIRYLGPYRGESRWIVAAETWAMIPFLAWSIWFTDKLASPLDNAYLLVIITSALTVGMRTTMYQLGLIAVCVVLAGEISSAQVLFSFGHLSGLVAQLTPLIIVAYVTSMFSSDIRYGMSKARLLSEIDELTGLYNIRGLAIVADRLFGHAARHDHPASLLLIDIDKLNAIGEVHGYQAGNALLRATANCIEAELRHNDVLARCGDDEFVAILQETASRGALEVAERIRSAIAAASITFEEKRITATVSVGLASYDGAGRSIDAVLARAERAVRVAEEQGRNRSVALPA